MDDVYTVMSIVSTQLWQLNDTAMSIVLPQLCQISWYSCVECVGIAMSLTSTRLDGTLLHMSEQENTLSYALTPNLGRSAKSVAVKRYSAQMKSTGTVGDAEFQEALAAASGAKVEFIRYLEELRRGIIEPKFGS